MWCALVQVSSQSYPLPGNFITDTHAPVFQTHSLTDTWNCTLWQQNMFSHHWAVVVFWGRVTFHLFYFCKIWGFLKLPVLSLLCVDGAILAI